MLGDGDRFERPGPIAAHPHVDIDGLDGEIDTAVRRPARWAVVFSLDEKTQCQALDRTQPSLPLKPGRAKCCKSSPK